MNTNEPEEAVMTEPQISQEVAQPQVDPYNPPLEVQEVVSTLTDEIGRLSGELKMTEMRLLKVQEIARSREADLNAALQELTGRLVALEQPFRPGAEPGGQAEVPVVPPQGPEVIEGEVAETVHKPTKAKKKSGSKSGPS